MYYYVNFIDLLLAPIYIYIFYKIVRWISKKYYSNDLFLQKKLMQGFWLKIIASIFFILISQFYYGAGDTFMFYSFSKYLHTAIADNISNISFLFSDEEQFYEYLKTQDIDSSTLVIGYMAALSNQMTVRVASVFGFFSFQNFTIISFFFSMLSYIGIWRMYLVFYKVFNNFKKEVSFSFLFLPSFLFWGSGILKDPICLFSLGILIDVLFNLTFYRKFSFGRLIGVFVSVCLVLFTKSYILYAFIISFTIMLSFLFVKKANVFLKFFLFLIVTIILALNSGTFISLITETIQSEAVGAAIEQSQKNRENYENAGGSFVDIGNFDPSLSGIILKIPTALINVFFRPFIWEARSPVLFISMLESMLFLFLFLSVLIKSKIIFFFSAINKHPVYVFFFLFSILLGIIVGLTTFNFGTILRYKIPCLPFLSLVLLILNKKKAKTTIEKLG
jgi:hypothetical protein